MSMNAKKNVPIAALVILFSAIAFDSQALAANPSADELVAQHLDSIANSTTRAGLKTRLVQAPVRFTILNASTGVLDGKAVLVSQGKKFQFMVKLPNNEYRGEQFIFDGEKDKSLFPPLDKHVRISGPLFSREMRCFGRACWVAF